MATFFAEESGLIESRLLTLSNLEGPSTGRNIAKLIMDSFASLDVPLSNCIAFCSDNANVMMGKKNGVAAVLTEAHESIVKIGCPCHLINTAAEKAASCLPAKVDEVLVDIFFYLERSAKRNSSLKEFHEIHNKEFRKILKHVPTRWLSLGKCLERLLYQWAQLLSFFSFKK